MATAVVRQTATRVSRKGRVAPPQTQDSEFLKDKVTGDRPQSTFPALRLPASTRATGVVWYYPTLHGHNAHPRQEEGWPRRAMPLPWLPARQAAWWLAQSSRGSPARSNPRAIKTWAVARPQLETAMTTLTVKDLPAEEGLDSKQMSAVQGGRMKLPGQRPPGDLLMSPDGEPVSVYVDGVLINSVTDGFVHV